MPSGSTFEIGTQNILLKIDGFLKGWILNITPLKVIKYAKKRPKSSRQLREFSVNRATENQLFSSSAWSDLQAIRLQKNPQKLFSYSPPQIAPQ